MTYPSCWLKFAVLMLALLVWGCGTDEPVSTGGSNNAANNGNNGNNSNNLPDCTNHCSHGEQVCVDEVTFLSCVQGENGCLDFGSPTECPAGRECENGTCIEEHVGCDNLCSLGDPPRCGVQGGVERCADHNQDGCRTYGDATACGEGQVCDAQTGACEDVECGESCVVGESRCDRGRLATCREESNGCTTFGAAKDCPASQVCEDDECVAASSCTDECALDEYVCAVSNGVRICDDWNGNGCTEFSDVVPCDANQECRAGECVATNTCQDQCLLGESVCVGNQISHCGDFNNDGCLEFDTPVACPTAGHSCQRDGSTSSCQAVAVTGDVFINEIFYDPMGHDLRSPNGGQCQSGETNCTSPSFIELRGTPGFDISDYELEIIGANGQVYNSATLPPGAALDGYGFAVLAMDQPDSFLTFAAPFYTNVYYILESASTGNDALQNTRSSVVLYDRNLDEADAVSYGTFSDTHVIRGQGDPATGTISGRSIGRIPGQVNTGNNATDFRSYYPTPGLENSDLLINEVYPNQPGANDGTETFVELMAPILGWEDMPLHGYVLHGIAGDTGQDYLSTSGSSLAGIPLSGVNLNDGGSSDGYVVICHEDAAPALAAICSVTYDGVPFYTGPDNFVLKRGADVIDSIGYGDFTAQDVFAGQGNPIPYRSIDAGKSLGRWPLTDPNYNINEGDNFFDFHLLSPTPGRTNPRP